MTRNRLRRVAHRARGRSSTLEEAGQSVAGRLSSAALALLHRDEQPSARRERPAGVSQRLRRVRAQVEKRRAGPDAGKRAGAEGQPPRIALAVAGSGNSATPARSMPIEKSTLKARSPRRRSSRVWIPGPAPRSTTGAPAGNPVAKAARAIPRPPSDRARSRENATQWRHRLRASEAWRRRASADPRCGANVVQPPRTRVMGPVVQRGICRERPKVQVMCGSVGNVPQRRHIIRQRTDTDHPGEPVNAKENVLKNYNANEQQSDPRPPARRVRVALGMIFTVALPQAAACRR